MYGGFSSFIYVKAVLRDYFAVYTHFMQCALWTKPLDYQRKKKLQNIVQNVF